MRLVDAAPLL